MLGAVALVAALAAWYLQRPAGDGGVPGDAQRGAEASVASGEFVEVAPVADWTAVDDPARDGWETEAWQEAAKKELSRVGHWVEELALPGTEELAALVDPAAPVEPFVPARLERVREDELLRVERYRRGPDAPAVGMSEADGMASSLALWGSQLVVAAAGGVLQLVAPLSRPAS